MKTAISIPDDVFIEVEKFAREHDLSRSEVFAEAAREYLERLKSRLMLEALNEVYSEPEGREDAVVRKKALKHYARRLSKEPY